MKKNFLLIFFFSFFLIPFNSVFALENLYLSNGTKVDKTNYHLYLNELRESGIYSDYAYCVYKLESNDSVYSACSKYPILYNDFFIPNNGFYLKVKGPLRGCNYLSGNGCTNINYSEDYYSNSTNIVFTLTDHDLYDTSGVLRVEQNLFMSPTIFYHYLNFISDLEDYIVTVYDSDNNEVEAEEKGYKLRENTDYTYTATKKGYKDISNTINLSSDKTINLNFEIYVDTTNIFSMFSDFYSSLSSLSTILFKSELFLVGVSIVLVFSAFYLVLKFLGGRL